VRIMRRVISPRLAMRILWNGGFDGVDADVDENGRFDDDDVTSMVWGRAHDSHRDEAVDELFVMPLQAVRKNNLEEDIVQIIYGCKFVRRTLNSSDDMMAAERHRLAVSSQLVHFSVT